MVDLQLDKTAHFFVGPILWGHSGSLCHALSLASSWTSMRKRRATVLACDSSDTWWMASGGSQWRMGPTFFKCFLFSLIQSWKLCTALITYFLFPDIFMWVEFWYCDVPVECDWDGWNEAESQCYSENQSQLYQVLYLTPTEYQPLHSLPNRVPWDPVE